MGVVNDVGACVNVLGMTSDFDESMTVLGEGMGMVSDFSAHMNVLGMMSDFGARMCCGLARVRSWVWQVILV